MSELDRIVTLPNQPAMTQHPRVVVQSPGDPYARQIPFWRAVEDVIRSSNLIADPQAPGMHVHDVDVSAGGTSFPGLLPTEPDLSSSRTAFLYVRGTGLFTLTTGTPGVFEFALSGDTNQDVTFGQALEADDVAVAIYAGRAESPPRYFYMAGSVMSLTAGATPWIWAFNGTTSGTIEVDASGSVAKCQTAATDEVVASVYHNALSIGTLTFSAAATSGTFSIASEVSLTAGDLIYFIFPSPADATLAGVSITMRVKYDG